MQRSYPSALRIQQRLRLRRRLVAAAFAAIAACAVAYAVALAMAPERAAVAAEALAPASQEKLAASGSDAPPARRVYRYSVVPGGAANGAELAHAIRSDRVVANHYAGFDVQQARAVTVAAPRAVHVSYRKGDTVYWTAKKTMLKAGETLLTDGHNEMRARCANRISDVPRFPVEAHGPSPESLDKVVDGHGIETEGEISYVDAPVPVPDEPNLPGQAFRPVWPDNDDPVPADPRRTRPPLALDRTPGLPWPAFGWPGMPPQSDETPQPPVLTFAAPPPLSGWVNVAPDPAPLVPQPDPGQPAPPPNPPLDLPPPPADVPEPGTLWLAAIALAAMLGLRRQV